MSSPERIEDGTLLMNAAAAGDRVAAKRLWELVYQELQASARRQLAQERPGHTLSATALVNEAFMRLARPREVPWASRAQFYAAAAQAMRRILVEHARKKVRRAGGMLQLGELTDAGTLADADPEKIVALDDAITRLEEDDPEAATVVRFRFFAGLSAEETAVALGMSRRSVSRLWAYARAVLFRELGRDLGQHP